MPSGMGSSSGQQFWAAAQLLVAGTDCPACRSLSISAQTGPSTFPPSKLLLTPPQPGIS